jgi:hypothetical protein
LRVKQRIRYLNACCTQDENERRGVVENAADLRKKEEADRKLKEDKAPATVQRTKLLQRTKNFARWC